MKTKTIYINLAVSMIALVYQTGCGISPIATGANQTSTPGNMGFVTPVLNNTSPIAPGIYTGTLTGLGVTTNSMTNAKVEIPINYATSQIINDFGMPCTDNGVQIDSNTTSNSQVGNISIFASVLSVAVTADGILIPMAISMSVNLGPQYGTVLFIGEQQLALKPVDANSMSFQVTAMARDKSGIFVYTCSYSGILSK